MSAAGAFSRRVAYSPDPHGSPTSGAAVDGLQIENISPVGVTVAQPDGQGVKRGSSGLVGESGDRGGTGASSGGQGVVQTPSSASGTAHPPAAKQRSRSTGRNVNPPTP